MRAWSATAYLALAGGAFVALVIELVVGFPFLFAPGWANGWPGGLTIHRVWSAGMTAYLYVMTISFGVGLGGLIGALLYLFPVSRQRAGRIFFAWLVFWTGFTVLFSMWFYGEIYESTLAMWPNGYPA